MSRPLRVVLLGHGPVARAFLDLVDERAGEIGARHGLGLTVVGIRASNAQVLLRDDRVPARDQWSPAGSLDAFLTGSAADLVVQAIPSRADLVDTAFEQVVASFAAGMDVATATKSHLVHRWTDLDTAARQSGRRLRTSGATGAALPAADLARQSLRGFPCERIRGSLNGTSSFVLDRLAGGGSLSDAVGAAQVAGIAEADVASDLDGSDAASKLVLLANLLWARGLSIDDVERDGIDDASADRAARAARAGRRLRAVAVADGGGRAVVRLEELDEQDPLYPVRGPEKAVAFDCGEIGQIVVSGGKASPRGAAHALLKDVLNLGLEGSPGLA
jgi:homoserine dehydrogenase